MSCLVVHRFRNEESKWYSNELELVMVSLLLLSFHNRHLFHLCVFQLIYLSLSLIHSSLSWFHTKQDNATQRNTAQHNTAEYSHSASLILVCRKPSNTRLLSLSLALNYGQDKRLINFLSLTLATVLCLYHSLLLVYARLGDWLAARLAGSRFSPTS